MLLSFVLKVQKTYITTNTSAVKIFIAYLPEFVVVFTVRYALTIMSCALVHKAFGTNFVAV